MYSDCQIYLFTNASNLVYSFTSLAVNTLTHILLGMCNGVSI